MWEGKKCVIDVAPKKKGKGVKAGSVMRGVLIFTKKKRTTIGLTGGLQIWWAVFKALVGLGFKHSQPKFGRLCTRWWSFQYPFPVGWVRNPGRFHTLVRSAPYHRPVGFVPGEALGLTNERLVKSGRLSTDQFRLGRSTTEAVISALPCAIVTALLIRSAKYKCGLRSSKASPNLPDEENPLKLEKFGGIH